MADEQNPKGAPDQTPKPEDRKPAASASVIVSSASDRALADMMRNAKTTDEKVVAALTFVYDRVILKLSERSENLRADDVEIEQTRMRHDMIKWVVQRAQFVLLICALFAGIILAWNAHDRDLAKDIIKYLIGGVAGFGIKSAMASATAKD